MTLAFTPEIFALILAVYLLGGVIKGALGFGLPTVAITVLPFLVPAQEALALNALVILATNAQQIAQAGALRPGFAAAWPMMIGMAITVPLGAFFAAIISAKTLMAILGVFVLAFVVISYLRPTLRIPPGRARPIGFGMGLVAGFVGALTTSPGSIFVTYAVSLHLPRPVYMAALGCIMMPFGIVLVGSYVWVGILDWERLPGSLLVIVPGVLGVWLGNMLGRHIEVETFRRIVLALLALLAAMMVRRALG